MPKKHIWSTKEDLILMKVRNELEITQWSQIARVMNSNYGSNNITGKQCRDRFINKLSLGLEEREWSQGEDRVLMQLQKEYGRRWSVAAQVLKGRSQSSIKNHFYARLRKSVRDLNRLIQTHLHGRYTTISETFMGRMLKLSEKIHKDEGFGNTILSQKAMDLIEFMFFGVVFPEREDEQWTDLLDKMKLIQELGGVTAIVKKGKQEVKQKGCTKLQTPKVEVKLQPQQHGYFQPYWGFTSARQ